MKKTTLILTLLSILISNVAFATKEGSNFIQDGTAGVAVMLLILLAVVCVMFCVWRRAIKVEEKCHDEHRKRITEQVTCFCRDREEPETQKDVDFIVLKNVDPDEVEDIIEEMKTLDSPVKFDEGDGGEINS